jgi:hypothetical protein
MEDLKKCKICGFETKSNNGFGSHVKQNHKMNTKEYYDTYVLNGEKVKCKQCDNEASFYNIAKGYREHCGKSCSKKVQPNAVGWTHSKREDYVVWNKGKPMSEEYKKNWLNSVKNTRWRANDEDIINKLRLAFIKNLKEINKSFHPPYSKRGCEYFNKLMEDTGIKIQHAENGGEFYIKELGYWVDGYDKENNIVYEWDDKRHYINNELLDKDKNRQRRIEDFLKCKFIRIKETY